MPNTRNNRTALARIAPNDTQVFLYNYETKEIYGSFKGSRKGACSRGGCALKHHPRENHPRPLLRFTPSHHSAGSRNIKPDAWTIPWVSPPGGQVPDTPSSGRQTKYSLQLPVVLPFNFGKGVPQSQFGAFTTKAGDKFRSELTFKQTVAIIALLIKANGGPEGMPST